MFYINEIRINLRQTFIYAFVNFSIFFFFSEFFYNLLLTNMFFINLDLSIENKTYFISTHPNEIIIKCFNITLSITMIYTLAIMILNFIRFLVSTFAKNILFLFILMLVANLLFYANLQYILLAMIHTTIIKFLQYDYDISTGQFVWVEPNPTVIVSVFLYLLFIFTILSVMLTIYIFLNSLLKLQIFTLTIVILFTLKLAFLAQLFLLAYCFLLLYVLLFKLKKVNYFNKVIDQN